MIPLLLAALVGQLPGEPPHPGAGGSPDTGAGGGSATESNITKPYLDGIVLRLAREGNVEGLKQLAEENYPAALAAFLESHALAPGDPEIANNVAFTYHRLGNHDRAEHFYRLTIGLDDKRVVAHLNLADLLVEQGPERLPEARELLLRARELAGNTPAILLRQARVETRQAQFVAAERLYREIYERPGHHDPGLQLEIGDLYRDYGRPEEALRWYTRLAATDDAALAAAARDRIRQLEVDDQARRFGFTRRSIEIPSRARALTDQATAFVRQSRPADAERVLREALALAPAFTEARQSLGDVLRAQDRVAEAETAYLRALAFDQGNAEVHARLAELYLTGEPPRPASAVILLERAVQLAPQPGELQLQLARAYRLTGDLSRALRAVEAYLAEAPEGGRWEAQLLRTTLQTLLQGGEVPDAEGAEGGTSAELRAIYTRVRVLLSRGETDAAMVELRRATQKREGDPALRNLEARIMRAAGRDRQAAAAFETSLALDTGQPGVHTELALLREASGDRAAAREHLTAAEQLGDLDAAFHLARLTFDDYRQSSPWRRLLNLGRLLEARERVERFVVERPASIYGGPAQTLAEKLRATLLRWALAGGGCVGLLLLLVGLGFQHRRGGETLAWLLGAHPETGPEVQRVLAAIRHEVLKHNTMVLTGLAEAIERGEGAVEAAQVGQSLLGEGGVAARLRLYTRQLKRIGRTQGVRLNLLHNDPALSALHRGFGELRGAERDLRRVAALGTWRRNRLLARLKRAGHLLNTDGYEAVCALLDGLRVLRVDDEFLRGIHRRTVNEPGLRALALGALEIVSEIDLPVAIAMPRAIFEDVLGNLFRNAIQASSGDVGAEIAIGLLVKSEVNAITGHERVCFGVADRSSQTLTTAALRARDIEGGLGLVTGLVSRYDGTVSVDQEVAGWAKAVVVKLPREEEGVTT